MIFETLYASSKNNELLLVENAFCRWHLRKDGQLTIHEIISLQPGQGKKLLSILKKVPNALCIVAKCPKDLKANEWYAKQGFIKISEEITKTGRVLFVWKLNLTD